MKIAIVARDYHSRGGLERVSQFYARNLRDRGHEVHVWYGNGSISELDDGLTFHKINTHLSGGWLYCLIFAILITFRVKPEVFDSVIIMGAAGVCRGSVIIANSVHREWFHYSLGQLPAVSLRRVLKLLNPLHYVVVAIEHLQYRQGWYRSVIAVSDPIKSELTKHYKIPPRSIHVLPNGTDHKVMEPDVSARERVRRELEVGTNELLMCMLVNELERKGVRQAMAALSQLREHPLKLLVVTKVNLQQVRKLAEQANVLDRVIIKAATPDARGYLWASDLYLLPTQYEAWNLSIMEAQAAGLPVITTKLDQADRVVVPGETGFLLDDPLDLNELVSAIYKWIAISPADKMRMSVESREGVRSYSWQSIVTELESILAESKNAKPPVVASARAGREPY